MAYATGTGPGSTLGDRRLTLSYALVIALAVALLVVTGLMSNEHLESLDGSSRLLREINHRLNAADDVLLAIERLESASDPLTSGLREAQSTFAELNRRNDEFNRLDASFMPRPHVASMRELGSLGKEIAELSGMVLGERVGDSVIVHWPNARKVERAGVHYRALIQRLSDDLHRTREYELGEARRHIVTGVLLVVALLVVGAFFVIAPAARDLRRQHEESLRLRQAEQAQRASELRFRRLAEAAPILMWGLRPDGSCDYFNDQWLAFVGASREDATHQHWLDYVHPDKRAAAEAGMSAALAGRETFELECHLRRHDGVYVEMLVRTSPLRDAALAYHGLVGTCVEVTALKQAQAQLGERTELLEIALRASSDGLWDWNVETNQNYLSPRWKALLGFGEDDVDDNLSVWQARIHPDERDMVAREVEAHLDNKRPFDVEYRMQTRYGEWRWFHVRGIAVRDADGRPRRMAGFTTDIHDRKLQDIEIQRTRTLLSEAIEVLDAGIARFDADNCLVFCNQRFRSIYGFSEEDTAPGVSGIQLLGRFYDANPERRSGLSRRAFIERFMAERGDAAVSERKLGDRWVMISERPTADGGSVSLHTEITAIKEIQTNLTLAMEKAEAASVAKTQFLANMSHELRTPLNGVIGMLQMLEAPEIPKPFSDYVDVALRSGRALLELINDVLDFSRIESGALELEVTDFDLGELVADTLAAVTAQARQKGLTVECRVDPALPPALRGDPLRLRQVLVNLLGNSLKFTPQGRIDLRLSLREGGTRVSYEVEDSGIGISPEQQVAVFERFSQADASTTRRFGGAGLGLAISRQLVRSMGGEMRIASELGVGTRIWFDLPLEEGQLRERGAAHDAPLSPVSLQGRVLVVDDVETNRLVGLAMLQRLGLNGAAAAGGDEALVLVTTESFDLILMDCQMPGMDGYETTLKLSALLGERCPPVVAMTAHVAPEDRERALAAGMCDYLTKPIAGQALRSVVERWLPGTSLTEPPRFTTRAGEEVLARAKFDELAEAIDPAGMAQLFLMFMQSMRKQLSQLNTALEEGDLERVKNLGHAMKGTSANVGAMRLSILAARMERAAGAEDAPGMAAVLDVLPAAMDELDTAIESSLHSLG